MRAHHPTWGGQLGTCLGRGKFETVLTSSSQLTLFFWEKSLPVFSGRGVLGCEKWAQGKDCRILPMLGLIWMTGAQRPGQASCIKMAEAGTETSRDKWMETSQQGQRWLGAAHCKTLLPVSVSGEDLNYLPEIICSSSGEGYSSWTSFQSDVAGRWLECEHHWYLHFQIQAF